LLFEVIMSLVSKAIVLVLFAVAAPLAGCGSHDPIAGAPDGGTPDAGSSRADICKVYCQEGLACVDPQTCTLAAPAAASSACASTCEAAYTALTPAQSLLMDACFSCINQAAAGKCPDILPQGTCDSVCNTDAANAAGEAWAGAFRAMPSTPATQCTNGMDALGGGSCAVSAGDPTKCEKSCCNHDACATPDVAIVCTGASLDMCTCTAGKNAGKTFQSSDGCSSDVWTLCNL
jgi:hypothetical protein